MLFGWLWSWEAGRYQAVEPSTNHDTKRPSRQRRRMDISRSMDVPFFEAFWLGNVRTVAVHTLDRESIVVATLKLQTCGIGKLG